MHKSIKKTALICAGLLICTGAFADSLKLTVQDSVKRALEGNITLKQSQLNLNSLKRTKNLSWGAISPTVTASGSWGKATENELESLGFNIGVNLALTPSLYTSINGAVLNYEKGLLDYESAVKSIELNVRKVYYSLLFEKENIALQNQTVESSKKQYESTQAKYNRGAIPQIDVLSSQVTYQNNQLNLENQKMQFVNDIANFKQLLGIDQSEEVELTGSLEELISNKDISIEGIEIKNSKVASLEKQIEIARNNLLSTRFTAWGPTLSASYSYAPGATSLDDFETWKDGGRFSVGASIPLDGFLPWSRGAQSIYAQQDALKNLELQLNDAKTSQQVNIDSCLRKINQYKQSVELRKKSVELAQKSYNMMLEAYNHGTRDLITLQNSADKLLQAQVQLKSEIFNLAAAQLDLENAIGVEYGSLSK